LGYTASVTAENPRIRRARTRSGASGLVAASPPSGRRPRRARDEGLDPVLQLGEGARRHPGRGREDDSPELHAEDVWRSSHETADMALVEILTTEAPSAIHWLEELGVEFTRENGATA